MYLSCSWDGSLMRCFCENFAHLSLSLGHITSYSVFSNNHCSFLWCIRYRQGRASLGPQAMCGVDAGAPPATEQLLSQGAGFEPQHWGPLALMLGGHRVLACLPLIAAHLVFPARGRVLIHCL